MFSKYNFSSLRTIQIIQLCFEFAGFTLVFGSIELFGNPEFMSLYNLAQIVMIAFGAALIKEAGRLSIIRSKLKQNEAMEREANNTERDHDHREGTG